MVWHLTNPDKWANIWSAKCVSSPKKSVLCKLNRLYKLKIGLDRHKKSVFCNPVLPYPIPSYQIPSLPHPTRILNTILHLYKILLSYTTLSYHIEIEPNRPTAETSRIGTPSKFTQAEKSRPKRPKLLFAQPKCWNHLDWFTVPFFG